MNYLLCPEFPWRPRVAEPGAQPSGLLSGFVVAEFAQKRSWRWKMWRLHGVVNDTEATERVRARENR
jgi:hypothetical protein